MGKGKVRHLVFPTKAIQSGEGRTTALITDATVDREAEVLVPDGMYSKNFERNPIVLWEHTSKEPGYIMGTSSRPRRTAEGWEATCTWAERPESHVGEWKPDTVRALVEQGIVKAVSVGFEAIESRRSNKSDYDRYGPNVQQVTSKWDLCEWSWCAVGMNPNALRRALDEGDVTTKSLRELGIGIEVPHKRVIVVF